MSENAHHTTREVAQAIADGMPPCPICEGRNVRRSESVRFEDRIMAFLRYTPYRCRTCQHRFYKKPEQCPPATNVQTATEAAPAEPPKAG